MLSIYRGWIQYVNLIIIGIGMSGRRSSWLAFGRSSTTLVATRNNIIFSLFFIDLFSFSVVYFPHRRSARIKKLILRRLTGPLRPFWGNPSGHFGFYKQCSIAGSERVPQAPLGWYSECISVNWSCMDMLSNLERNFHWTNSTWRLLYSMLVSYPKGNKEN